MIRLAASDLDGTFVSYDGTISEENRKTVEQLNCDGIVFAAASGRNYEGISALFSGSGLRVECICANGAEYFTAEGEKISGIYLTVEKAEKVIAVFRRFHVPYMFFASEGIYTDQDEMWTMDALKERIQRRFGVNSALLEATPVMKHISDLHSIHLMKIEGFDMEPDLLKEVRRAMAEVNGVNAMSAAVDNLEVTDVEASKGKILEKVIATMGIAKDEVIVLGDGLNDLSLFECFEHSAAIGHSAPELKALAEIIDEDDHIGFARAVAAFRKKYG